MHSKQIVNHETSETSSPMNNSFSESSLGPNATLSELRAPVECAICLNSLLPTSHLQVLSCAHTFHSECILQWILNNRSCPVCRSRVELPLECFDSLNTRRRVRRYRQNIVTGIIQINNLNGTAYRETRSSILRRQYGTQRRHYLDYSSHSPPNSTAVNHPDLTLQTQMPVNRDLAVTHIVMNQSRDRVESAEPRMMAVFAALLRYNQANSQR
ncbi:unnamed protein product [Hymenolepis diminuta]|uniref:RING-type domain-containing protein n=1 Tax=Hymenolepis diminuta TaxID=6216 RepID=A0A564Z9M4_HYMDI|nr:unnamed protein product [Hymenolepis diminuta]